MEIEERAFVDSFPNIIEKLEDKNFSKKQVTEIKDAYFCRKNCNTVQDIQMDEPGSFGLRIREKQRKAELNCKVIKERNDHNAFIEHETDIESPSEARKILQSIGFKQFCKVEKSRVEYTSSDGEITVNLEDLKEFPPVIEIEIIAENQIEEKKASIRELLRDLGVCEDDVIDKSITLLYFKQNAFQN